MEIKSTLKLLPVAIAFVLTGCTDYINNVRNDSAHMGDPTYDNCRRNYRGDDYGVRCAREADPNVKAAEAEQKRQDAEQNRLAAEAMQKNLAARQNEELAKGYSPITIQDFVLDGKKLATRKAKRSLTGVYLPVGNLELLFSTNVDAIQFSNGSNLNSAVVHLLTNNASREFRRQLLACRSNPTAAIIGCHVHVIGSATMCVLSGPFDGRRDVPCVSVDNGSVEIH